MATPELVAHATALAHRAGFTRSCEPGTGALLAVLAAAVPAGGRILELGTGAGVGTAWLIFADAQGGKWHGLDTTIAALRPGGHLLVDDMTPPYFADGHHEHKTGEVRTRILSHPDLVSVPIAWSTGLILSTRPRI
jgi:hypothetical protein